MRTGSGSARDKYPKKSPRKNLFTSPSKQLTLSPSSLPALSTPPPLPQHDPFTPSKRRDPTYVPYYVTNFEYVLGCVIDCTDDRELFTSEELNIIQSYRRMSLPARKLYVRLDVAPYTFSITKPQPKLRSFPGGSSKLSSQAAQQETCLANVACHFKVMFPKMSFPLLPLY